MRCPTLNELPPPPADKSGWPWTTGSERLPDLMPEGSPWPRISIVTPSFNQARFIEETIRSVLLQGYPDLEYIIIDGGSTDDSVEIIRKYEPWLAHWISEKDRGQSNAINKGWNCSSGTILAWLNSDDYYFPDTIKFVAEEFVANGKYKILVGTGVIVDQSGRHLLKKFPGTFSAIDMLRLCGATPSQPAVFLRRMVFDTFGELNEDLHYVMDWEYWIRICLELDPEQMFLSEVSLAASRSYADTKTNKGVLKICQEHRHIMDSIFESDRFNHLRAYRRQALKNSYWKQANLARKGGDHKLAWNSAVRAWILLPRLAEITRMARYTAGLLKRTNKG
jgi:glycosyltransferase involved in cell wall biosynthesis